MRRSQGMYTIGLVSTPVSRPSKDQLSLPVHDSTSSYPSVPANFPATFTTTPMEHLDFTLSQISPGLGVDNLQPPVSSPPPHKGTSSSTTSPVATPSSYPRYESVFKSRYSSTPPLSSLSVKPAATSAGAMSSANYLSSRIYTITSPTTLREPGSSAASAFTSIGSSLKPLETSPLSTLTTFTAASSVPGTNVTTFIKTTTLTAKTPSPERPLRVNLDSTGGYDNLQFEPDSTQQPKSNLETWQAKQKGMGSI